MRSTTTRLWAAVGLLGLMLVVPAAPATAAPGMSLTVDQVLVNRLGGVSVVGTVDCSAVHQQILAGTFMVETESGYEALVLGPGDSVNLYANNDNYTVSQPAGRKAMIQVTHESSQMSPCFTQTLVSGDGHVLPCVPGSPCPWATMAYSYDPALGPLFDYSPDGRFKAGTLNVTAWSVGVLVEVIHPVGEPSYHFVNEGSYATTSGLIRAVSYR